MAEAIIQVSATTTPNSWLAQGNSSKVICVNSPDDDDSTYIKDSGRTAQQFSLAANTIPIGSTINNVFVFTRTRRASGSGGFIFVRAYLGASFTQGSNNPQTNLWRNLKDNVTRPGGGSWQLSDIASLQVRISSLVPAEVRCTTLYVIVDYTPAVIHTSDSYLVFQPALTHEIDSYLVFQFVLGHDTDSYLAVSLVTLTKTHEIDSYLVYQPTLYHTIDVLITTKFIGNEHNFESIVDDINEADSKSEQTRYFDSIIVFGNVESKATITVYFESVINTNIQMGE